jgi:hypothetical protein
VLKFRTYSVGAAHIPACILRNVWILKTTIS